jgi:hypothetical protein
MPASETYANTTDSTVTVSKQFVLHACNTCCLPTVSRFVKVSSATFPSFFGYDCGVGIDCRVDPFSSDRFVYKNILYFGYLKIFNVTTLLELTVVVQINLFILYALQTLQSGFLNCCSTDTVQ